MTPRPPAFAASARADSVNVEDGTYDHYAWLARRREFRTLRILRVAERLAKITKETDPKRRSRFSLAEIADECRQVQGRPEQEKRSLIVEWLQRSLMQGDFGDPEGRSTLVFLDTSPLAEFRFRPRWATDIGRFNSLLNKIWMKRADCQKWLTRWNVSPPASWGFLSTERETVTDLRAPTNGQRRGRAKTKTPIVQRLLEKCGRYPIQPGEFDPKSLASEVIVKAKELATAGDEDAKIILDSYGTRSRDPKRRNLIRLIGREFAPK